MTQPPEIPHEAFAGSVRRAAARAGGTVVGMLAWIDPAGNWWIAPLGAAAPAPDGPPPPDWVPIQHLRRTDMI